MSDQHLDQLRQLAKQPPATQGMPVFLRCLHRRIMNDKKQEREGRRQLVDDEGRSWGPAPGITQTQQEY